MGNILLPQLWEHKKNLQQIRKTKQEGSDGGLGEAK